MSVRNQWVHLMSSHQVVIQEFSYFYFVAPLLLYSVEYSHSRWGRRENMQFGPQNGAHHFIHIPFVRNKVQESTKDLEGVENIVYLQAQERKKLIWNVTSQYFL